MTKGMLFDSQTTLLSWVAQELAHWRLREVSWSEAIVPPDVV